MKILLVNPPRKIFPSSEKIQVELPLGLLYLAAALEQAGYEVEILDTQLDCQRPRHEEDFLIYGKPWHDIESEIKKRKPDLVGITNHFSAEIDNALAVAQIVKKINPSIHTIIGGPNATVQYSPILEERNDVDVVVIGEGEVTLVELAQAYSTGDGLSRVKGIAYLKDREIVVNPPREFIADLDTLPLPAYHLIDMQRYLHREGLRYDALRLHSEVPMITSRGCPFNCVFCAVHSLTGKKWRAHSAEYIINHIDVILKKFGVKHISFNDDNLILDIDRFDHILNGLQEKQLKFSWDSRGIRADRITLPLLQKMKDCGCTYLHIGIESGEQKILDKIVDKHLRLEDVVKAADMCHKVGVGLFGFYVIGFPGETKKDMQKTVDFALWLKSKYDVGMTLYIASPIYGSQLLKICEENGYLAEEITPHSLANAHQSGGKGLIKTQDFSPDDVNKIASQTLISYRRISLKNYLKHPIDTLRKAMVQPRRTIRYLKSLIRL